MNGEGEGNHLTFGKIILIGALAIAGIFIVKGLFKGDSGGGGLFSSNDCTTELHHKVPKTQLKGVGTNMTASRCAGTFDDNGNKKSYVEVSVVVNGKTDDSSVVQNVNIGSRLEKKSSGKGWQVVRPSDVKESELSTDVNKVGYTKTVRWNIRHIPARVLVSVTVKTNKGHPVHARHFFSLP
jgi:hypothetical protein